MKNNLRQLLSGSAAALFLALTAPVYAETVSTTTVSDGTISEFSPDTIVISGSHGATPSSYTYSKSTTYVDEAGAPVSIETVKSGLPVTVHYVKEGDRMVASRVIVHKRTTTTVAPVAPAAVEETRSTTTTTTVK